MSIQRNRIFRFLFFFFITLHPFYCQSETAITNDELMENKKEDDESSDLIALDEINEEEEDEQLEDADEPESQGQSSTPREINEIILVRNNKNKYLTDENILTCIPYKEHDIFDPKQTSTIIHTLYAIKAPYGFFEQIIVAQERLPNNRINLYIITYEKPELEEIIVIGNTKINNEDVDEKLNLGDIEAINTIDIQRIVRNLRKMYREKNYQTVEIVPTVEINDNKATVVISLNEGVKSLVKRINFIGNNHFKSKYLRNAILTHEDWLFGFFNNAGSYQPEMLEVDKHLIESYYKDHGYLMAKVTDTQVIMDPCTKQYNITFTIVEGDCYTVSDITIPGQGIVDDAWLLSKSPIRPGDCYSGKKVTQAIEDLRNLWGIYGYVFADVDPQIIPNEQTKTVSITLNSELGGKVYINRINIIGNKKTRNKVIRRRLTIDEGDLLTTNDMERSKARVENLGYFDPRNGVNWKINRLDENNADLDLMLKEVKTGRMVGELGFGGSQFNLSSVTRSFKFGGTISDSNLFGSGIMVRLGGSWSKEEWTIGANVADQWFLDKPILAEADFHITKADYNQELKDVTAFDERITAGFVGTGFTLSRSVLRDSAISIRVGGESIQHSNRPRVENRLVPGASVLQVILDRRFQSGSFAFLSFGIAQDYRNHTLHPSGGYQWSFTSRLGLSGNRNREEDCIPVTPIIDNGLGFAKFDLDASWFTPLIGDNSLVFGIKGHAGFVGALQNKDIPYRELYHIGGPATVRGFLYGQIGPMFLGNSIGAKKAFWVNTELVFPITADFSLKGALFYDGGAGWDTPGTDLIPEKDRLLLINNRFNFRHAIGIGFRMLRPQPIKVDVGFKLDKRKGENALEVHFSSYREF